jgi:hypothetical protein
VNRSDEENNWLDIGSKFRRRAMLWWSNGKPECILLVKKHGCQDALDKLKEVAAWCVNALPFHFARMHDLAGSSSDKDRVS